MGVQLLLEMTTGPPLLSNEVRPHRRAPQRLHGQPCCWCNWCSQQMSITLEVCSQPSCCHCIGETVPQMSCSIPYSRLVAGSCRLVMSWLAFVLYAGKPSGCLLRPWDLVVQLYGHSLVQCAGHLRVVLPFCSHHSPSFPQVPQRVHRHCARSGQDDQ